MSGGILHGAHDIVFKNSSLNDFSTNINQTVHNTLDVAKGSGLEKLLDASMPAAFHDSSERDPPPRCHPGTRQKFIDKIVGWSSGVLPVPERLLWMYGPAGVGKSAVAQSCTELLAEQNQLAAAFFFSGVNDRDKSTCLFPSISYQIATASDTYADVLDHKIRRDPTLVKKSIKRQFQELIVEPLQALRERGEDVKERVILVDGLDECAGAEVQNEIIEIIASSVRDGTTPFRWALFSRPESHIVMAFTSGRVRPLSLFLELPVSREIDHEILRYLTAEFKRLREKYRLPSSWPSEGDIGSLVDRSAGLFTYASTVIRFVGESNSSGPMDQLHAILSFSPDAAELDYPLSELDVFYILIMRHVPSKILPLIQSILLLNDLRLYFDIPWGANILGLSEAQFRNACASLSSVLELGLMLKVRFYHASFMEFLRDPKRSKDFCIYGNCLDTVRQEILERLNGVHARSTDTPIFLEGIPDVDLTCHHPNVTKDRVYHYSIEVFFRLCRSTRPLNSSTTASLVKFQFQMLPLFADDHVFICEELDPEAFGLNIPAEFRKKIIRRSYDPGIFLYKPKHTKWERPYILGYGKNKVLCWTEGNGWWKLVPYRSAFKFLPPWS